TFCLNHYLKFEDISVAVAFKPSAYSSRLGNPKQSECSAVSTCPRSVAEWDLLSNFGRSWASMQERRGYSSITLIVGLIFLLLAFLRGAYLRRLSVPPGKTPGV
ncbi:MAG TPA: hypothetical protein DEH25_01710, partial [Chloroflexi bacterium]|nr:hypothetical protein [Chloroflexota bacterium]